jgi:hypothetical protein
MAVEIDEAWIRRITRGTLEDRVASLVRKKWFYNSKPKRGEPRYNNISKPCRACGSRVTSLEHSYCQKCRKEDIRVYGSLAERTPAPDPGRRF